MKKLAILISGGGTTAEATIKACQTHELKGLHPIVISSNKDAKGNKRVKSLEVKLHVIDKSDFENKEDFDKTLFSLLETLQIDIVSLQGWLPLILKSVIKKYQGYIFNQHPGPLDPGRPDFGGKGMSTPYRVNSARIAYIWATGEEPWTESDTHFVTEDFDMGDLIRTAKMPIPAKKKKIPIQKLRENPEELIRTTHEVQKEFYPVEHRNVIATLQMFANGDVKGFKREQPLIPEEHIGILNEAKKLATELFPSYNL